MNNNNPNTNAQNKGSPYLYGLMILGMLISVIITVVACFLPAVISTIIFKLVKKRLPPPDNNHEHWVTLWAVCAQIILYIGGVLSFRKIVFVNGEFSGNDLLLRLGNYSSWKPLFLRFIFGFLPILSLYLIKLSDLFRDSRSAETSEFQNYTNINNSIVKLNIISAFFFPVNFYWFGVKAKKITWLLSGLVYSIPLAIIFASFIAFINGSKNPEVPALSLVAHFLMWTISLVQTNRFRNEYFYRIGFVEDTNVSSISTNNPSNSFFGDKEQDKKEEQSYKEKTAKDFEEKLQREKQEEAKLQQKKQNEAEAKLKQEREQTDKRQKHEQEQEELKRQREDKKRQEQEERSNDKQRKNASERDINWNSTDPFQIIGIPPSASTSEIKKAYHKVVAQYHPDIVASLAPEFKTMAEEKSKIINSAYEECLKRKAA